LATKAVRNLEEATRNVQLMNDENPCEQMSREVELKKAGHSNRRIRRKYVHFT